MDDLLELDEQVLTFDIADEVLERAANAEQNGFTLAYCTSYWNSCGLPPWALTPAAWRYSPLRRAELLAPKEHRPHGAGFWP